MQLSVILTKSSLLVAAAIKMSNESEAVYNYSETWYQTFQLYLAFT